APGRLSRGLPPPRLSPAQARLGREARHARDQGRPGAASLCQRQGLARGQAAWLVDVEGGSRWRTRLAGGRPPRRSRLPAGSMNSEPLVTILSPGSTPASASTLPSLTLPTRIWRSA